MARHTSGAAWFTVRIGSQLAALALLSLTAGFAGAQAGGAYAGRNVAASCASCHGVKGIGAGGMATLAGRPVDELRSRMQDFKMGRREGTVMPQLAKGYTDEQIEQAAAWLASQRISP